jgi:hypothetical protein
MSDFRTVALNQKALDPSKRVNYSMGLVLGVDEFEQEQYYILERDRLHNRSLHGYGTVCGLQVRYQDGEVQVLPGLAVDSRGQHICVPGMRCADLNTWLGNHENEIQDAFGSTPGALPLYVTLCYRECKTNSVPVPGEPCRTQADSMVASRIQDDFELKLSLKAPKQTQEELVDRFGDLLARIEIRDNASAYLTAAQMEALVLNLADEVSSTPTGSFPGDTTLFLRPEEARVLIELAFRTWVTRVRHAISDAGCCPAVDDECLLLARLDVEVQVDSQGIVVDGGDEAVGIDESERPHLLHTRLLQEWLMASRLQRTQDTNHQLVTLSAVDRQTLRAWIHFPILLAMPQAAAQVEIDGQAAVNITAITLPAANTNVFDLALDQPMQTGDRVTLTLDLDQVTAAADGTTMALLLDGERYAQLNRQDNLLTAVLVVDRQILDDLLDVDAQAPADGQVLTWRDDSAGSGCWTAADITAMQVGDAAGGDLSGSYPNPTVARLQTRPVSNAQPNNLDVLTWDGSRWGPRAAQAGSGGGVGLESGLTRIFGMNWRHNGFNFPIVRLRTANGEQELRGLVIVFGMQEPGDDGLVRSATVNDNTFQVFFERRDPETNLFLQSLRISPERIIPVMIDERIDDAFFPSVAEMSLTSEGQRLARRGLAPAVMMELSIDIIEKFLLGQQLRVVLKGDFILDAEDKPRAIDAEFIRGELPTGNRIDGGLEGFQGGLFESWFTLRINPNRASIEEITAVIGDANLARRLVELRTAGGDFSSVTNFNNRIANLGLQPEILRRLRDLVTIPRGG